jgi:hypothetical protein
MKRLPFILIWLAVILTGLTVPADRYGLVYKGIAPSQKFYPDHIENIYFIDDHRIIKLESNTGNRLEYGSLSAGTITWADVSNPFQILVFYRDFNRILFLNNRLAPLRREINMSNLGIDKAILVCSSGQGGVWVFSEQDNRVVYFDQQLQRSHQSMNINSIVGTGLQPDYMIEFQNRLYLHVPFEGILVFDRLATYLKTIPYAGPSRFRVMDSQIIYFDQGNLISLDFEGAVIRNLYLPADIRVDYADIQPERLYVLSGSLIYSYRVR